MSEKNKRPKQPKARVVDEFYRFYPQAVLFTVTLQVLGLISDDVKVLVRWTVLYVIFLAWTVFLLLHAQRTMLTRTLQAFYGERGRWWKWAILLGSYVLLFRSDLGLFECILILYGLANALFFKASMINAVLFLGMLVVSAVASTLGYTEILQMASLIGFYMLLFVVLGVFKKALEEGSFSRVVDK